MDKERKLLLNASQGSFCDSLALSLRLPHLNSKRKIISYASLLLQAGSSSILCS